MTDYEQTMFGGGQAAQGKAKPASLVILSGQHKATVVNLDRDVTTMGRDGSATLKIEGDPFMSRIHVKILREPSRYMLADNNSTNGVVVNGQRIKEVELRNGDRVQIGSTHVKFIQQDGLDRAVQGEVEFLTSHDGVTGFWAKDPFINKLTDEINSLRQFPKTMSLGLIEIDDFEAISKSQGFDAADLILFAVSNFLKQTITPKDQIARIEGRMFAILFIHEAGRSLEVWGPRVQGVIKRTPFTIMGARMAFTLTVGGQLWRNDFKMPDVWLSYARVQLDWARKLGGGGFRYSK
ncbi:MAG: diguanylate cyclase [Nitrospirae bacterium]|nr:diguanylate cyclase [Nitrospirota bacterium]